jgi:hypothetical protein
VHKDLPLFGADFFRVNGENDALVSKTFCTISNELRRVDRGGIDAHFIAAGFKHCVHILDGANPPANNQRHRTVRSNAFDHINDCRSPMRTGRDVEENHLVGSLFFVTLCELDWVADVAQLAFFGKTKLNTASDFSIVDIETRNDTFE